jgi:hypothetical protein
VYTAASGVPQIYEVGLTLFLTHIIRSPRHPIHTHLIATLLSQVQLERDGETITRSTVRECVDVLLRLTDDRDGKNVYLSDFEPEFLRRSGEFYRLEASEMLESGDAGLYLRNVGGLPVLRADFRSNGVSLRRPIERLTISPHSPTHHCRISSLPNSSLLIFSPSCTCLEPVSRPCSMRTG